MPYTFQPGEKAKFKLFEHYTSRNLHPWITVEVKETRDDAVVVVAADREFTVSAVDLQAPYGWEEIYDVCNDEENLRKVHSWLTTRGGVNIWRSLDLSAAGRSTFTPGDVGRGKPHWSMGFVETVTDPSRLKFILAETKDSKPDNAKKEGWKYARKGRIWWRETPWQPK